MSLNQDEKNSWNKRYTKVVTEELIEIHSLNKRK